MKLCIFSSPRTRSNALRKLIATHAELTDYGNIFAYGQTTPEQDTEKVAELTATDNYVAKITPTAFHFSTVIQYDTFPWSTFDKIIILNRKNLIQQVASWQVLMKLQRNTPLEEPVTQDNLSYSLDHINNFYKILQHIKQQNNVNVTLTYETFDDNATEYLSQLSSFVGTEFTAEQFSAINTSMLNFPSSYDEFINKNKLDVLCKSIITENNLTYLQEQFELGNIIY